MCIVCKSYIKGTSLSSETCNLNLFNISMKTLKPCYLHSEANFRSLEDRFKMVVFLLLTALEVCTENLRA